MMPTRFPSRDREQKPAFTLIELVLVMGILVIVLGLSMSSLLQSQSAQIFNNNFSKLYSMVNTARSLAIAGKGQLDYTDYDRDDDDHLTPDYVTPANYGVRFDTASGSANVRLFADIHPPLAGAVGQKGRFDVGTDYIFGHDLVLDSYSFPAKTELKIIDGADGTPTTGSFFFNMKYADISFENIPTSGTPFVRLQLTDQTTGACRQIRIHQLAGIPEVGPCS